MADNRYTDRGSWRDDDRERASYGAHDYAHSSYGRRAERDDDDRGFFERAGEEIRSWFSDDDDRESGRYERDRSYGRSSDRFGDDRGREWGSSYGPGGSDYRSSRQSGGFRSQDRWESNADRDFGRSSRNFGRSSSSFLGDEGSGGYGRSSSSWGQSSQNRDFGRDQGRSGFGGQGSWDDSRQSYGRGRSGQQGYGQSYGARQDRDDDRASTGGLMYEEFSGTLGGFGNQRFGSSQDDHYRNWRDRQMSELDRDYQEYCRDREQQFHEDFDSWRRNRRTSDKQSELGSGSASQTMIGSDRSSAQSPQGDSSIGRSTATRSTTSSATGSSEATDTSDKTAGAETSEAAGSTRSTSRSRS